VIVDTFFCASCLTPRSAGAVLLVVDRRTGSTWHLCRPTVMPWCLGSAGRRSATAIVIADQAAADDHDRQLGYPPGSTNRVGAHPRQPSQGSDSEERSPAFREARP
jgi:hypothetical protein